VHLSGRTDGGSDEGSRLSERLVRDLRDRRPEALDQLLAEFGRRIQGVAYLIVGSHADAEEVLIDTMVTAWRKVGDLRDPGALGAWLLRIATRHALTRRRRIGATLAMPPDAAERLVGAGPPPIDGVALRDALATLPPRMRAAIVLHYYADLTVEGVAAALERSPNTIKSQLRVGLARLRAELDDAPERSDA
jgi:RNA polymerase sigma-70 factor (ECF subfamily)